MNAKAVYIYLKLKANRNAMIRKIEHGFKHQNIEIKKDHDVEEFQKGFLKYWDKLEEFPEANEDLKGLNEKEKKEKITELKMQFCEWVSETNATSEGYMYGWNRKEEIRSKIDGASRSIKSKIKAGTQAIFGEKNKIGRNDLCPCGSGIKYKKCCGKN